MRSVKKRTNANTVTPIPNQKYFLQHCMRTPNTNTAAGMSQSGKIISGASGPYSEMKPAANQ